MSSVEELHGDDFVFRCLSVAVTTNTWSFIRSLFLLTNVVLKASPLPEVMVLGSGLFSVVSAPNLCSSAERGRDFCFFLWRGEADFFLSKMIL